jgi:hypothetical protein
MSYQKPLIISNNTISSLSDTDAINHGDFPNWSDDSLAWIQTLQAMAMRFGINKACSSQDVNLITVPNLTSDTYKWAGAVLAPNGNVYCIPYNSTTILKVNPETNIGLTLGDLSGSAKWFGGVLASNGCIYCIPYDSTSILKIDTFTDIITTFGELTGSAKWYGGVLASNGCIYGIPYNSSTILKIDPTTDTTTEFGDFASSTKWCGGVLASNGMVYCIPSLKSTLLKIDPTTDTALEVSPGMYLSVGTHVLQFESSSPGGDTAIAIDDIHLTLGENSVTIGNYGFESPVTGSWTDRPVGYSWTFVGSCGVAKNGSPWVSVAPEGVQVGFMQYACTITQTITVDIAGTYTLSFKAANRPSYTSNNIKVSIDGVQVGYWPSTDFTGGTFKTCTVGADSTINCCSGGVAAPNGMIYTIPYSGISVLKIDPANDTAVSIGNLTGTAKWCGGILAPNGIIYGIPYTSTTVLKIDTTTDIVTTFGSLTGSNKWVGGVVTLNGTAYCAPHSSSSVLKIGGSPAIDIPANFPLSRHFNKF